MYFVNFVNCKYFRTFAGNLSKTMQYSVVHLSYSFTEDWQQELLEQDLCDLGFEVFDGSGAYIQTMVFEENREAIEALLSETDGVQLLGMEQCEDINWNAAWEAEHEIIDLPLGVRITPHCAFGAGHHETTSMMIEALNEAKQAGLFTHPTTVLDMGCGTGVLAIVAVGCGAKRMMAVDIDDWACDSCRVSMALSGVEQSIDVRCGSIEAVKGEHYDFILANINRNILTDMMPSFAELLSSGGKLLMSGFLVEDVAIIEASAAEYGFESVERKERDGWVVVVCRKI